MNLALPTNFSVSHTMSEPSIRLNVIVYLGQLLTASNHLVRLQSSWCGVSTNCKSVKFLVITWFQNWTWILNHSKGLLRINTCWNNCSTLLWNASEWKNTFYIFMISKRQIGLPTMSANQYLGTNLKLSFSTFFKSEFHKMDSTFLSGFQTLRCDFISFQIQPLFEVPFENLSFRPTRLDPIHRHLNQSACYRSH